MKRALLLNSDWTPLNFVTEFRALNLLFRGRAEIVDMGNAPSVWGDIVFNTTTRTYQVPATLRLLKRVNRRLTTPRFRKRILFNRDNWQCQYCFVPLDRGSITVDHVVPRAMGGPTTWRNCVASCKKCNMKKGPRTLQEVGMNLRKNPMEPKVNHFWEFNLPSNWHPHWDLFFGAQHR